MLSPLSSESSLSLSIDLPFIGRAILGAKDERLRFPAPGPSFPDPASDDSDSLSLPAFDEECKEAPLFFLDCRLLARDCPSSDSRSTSSSYVSILGY